MNRFVATIALAATIATPALAADDTAKVSRNDAAATGQVAGGSTRATESTVGTQRIVGGAAGSNVRVALVYDYQYGVVRSYGAYSMRRPSNTVGVYCIRPKSLANAAIAASVPVVAADYDRSGGGTGVTASLRTTTLCNANEYGIYTMREVSGTYVASGNVGFNFIVP